MGHCTHSPAPPEGILRYAMIPNILCIAGAFMWGFTSLATVAVTNLGTYVLLHADDDLNPKSREAIYSGL